MSLLRSVDSRRAFPCRTPALDKQRMNAATDSSLLLLAFPQDTARGSPPD